MLLHLHVCQLLNYNHNNLTKQTRKHLSTLPNFPQLVPRTQGEHLPTVHIGSSEGKWWSVQCKGLHASAPVTICLSAGLRKYVGDGCHSHALKPFQVPFTFMMKSTPCAAVSKSETQWTAQALKSWLCLPPPYAFGRSQVFPDPHF